MSAHPPAEVAELIARSNRLGSDPRNTNYAGGNTSAKGPAIDPVTGVPADLLWVKGSRGDLGTLTAAGLAVLRLDRLRALTAVYPSEDREDEMVAAFDYCLHGKGGAARSIDTGMHGLVSAAHVKHLHPDAGIALAAAAEGQELTGACFGDRVAWLPWRRPGFQLGLDIAAVHGARPDAIGVILGGHGLARKYLTTTRCLIRSGWGARPNSRPSSGAWPAPIARRSGTSATTPSSFSSSAAPGTRRTPPSAPRAPTTSCARSSSRWCLTCRRPRRSRR